MNTIQYIVVNKELGMSPGKAMSQVAHAVSATAKFEDINKYQRANQKTVIALEGTSDQIVFLNQYLADRSIRSEFVIDEGVNEIPTMSVTALATEQFDIEDEEKRSYFKGFELYGGNSNDYYKTWEMLSDVINKGQGWYGAPWYVRKTVAWLNRKKQRVGVDK